ncbi:MAG: 23S rRNA (guanosine(2251)-2'-O)-methyltransferase RlmB [Chloroflexota bacterium]
MPENITGRNAVYETLQAGRREVYSLQIAKGVKMKGRINDIVSSLKQLNKPVSEVDRKLVDRIGSDHHGVALSASGYPYSSLLDMLELAEARQQAPFILILDTLKDPQNLGTLLRTAEAVGVHGILLPLRQTVTVTPAVVNASSGASEHMLISQSNLAQSINILKENDVWVIGLDGSPDAQPPEKLNLSGGLAVVVGSEGAGMRRLIRDSCDSLLRLPMSGRVESLNAAVAGSIALYLAKGARGWDS